MGQLAVRLLGPFDVRRDGRPVQISGNRLRTLLAVLAISAGEFVSVDAIGAAVWEDDLPDNVRRSLQTYVARLRRLIGDDAITTMRDGYLLAVDRDQVDALRFLRLTKPPMNAPDALHDGLALWRGMPFEGVRSEWLTAAEAPRLVERYLTAMEQRIDLDIAAGGSAQLVAELRELTGRFALRESLTARLLTVLDRTGRRAEALECYESIRARLSGELGVDPGPDLQRLYAGLLAADAGPGPRHGLAQGPVPRQLPSDIERFTGRADVLAALDDLLRDQSSRPIVIVAVHGTGGVGKTALAVHWAHRVSDRFPDGQLFVDLRGYGPGEPLTPAAALDILLRSLEIPGEQIPTDVDGRSAMLRSLLADRRMLIVLDNARDAAQVRPLLPGSSSLVIVTSRNQLRGLVVRDGAHRVALDQLDRTESLALLHQVLPEAAGPYDESILTALAESCGHLPLALLIAAEYVARGPDRGLSDLVAELRTEPARLDALEVAGDPAADLAAVFSWSYQTLEPDAARMFRLLGLHPGPDIDRAAAAALAGDTPRATRWLLDRLTEAHLVEQRRSGRYQQHDLVHAYAAQRAGRMDEKERAAALDRLCGWYLHTAANGRRALRRGVPITDVGEPPAGVAPLTFSDTTEARAWFDDERHNLVALIHDAADRGNHRAAFGITQMTWVYLLNRYLLDDIVALQKVAMDAAQAAGDGIALATSHNQLGATYIRLGDYERARSHYAAALEQFEAAGHDHGRASALGNLGWAFEVEGRFAEALEQQERGLAVARQSADLAAQVHLLNNLAMSCVGLRQFDRAIAACEEAIKLYQTHDLGSHEAPVWDTMGRALTARADHDRAIDAYQRALRIVRELDDRWIEALLLTHIGIPQRDIGWPDEARESWRQALAIFDEIGAADSDELSRPAILQLLATVTSGAA